MLQVRNELKIPPSLRNWVLQNVKISNHNMYLTFCIYFLTLFLTIREFRFSDFYRNKRFAYCLQGHNRSITLFWYSLQTIFDIDSKRSAVLYSPADSKAVVSRIDVPCFWCLLFLTNSALQELG